MMKEMLPYVGGMIVGAAICYGGYRLYKYYKKENINKTLLFNILIVDLQIER